MANFAFGKSIDFRFTPLLNGDPVNASELVSARLYRQAPSNSEIDLTTSGQSLQTVTAWSGLGDSEYLIQFDAVTDSDPHTITPYETYFVVTNFKYEADGPTVFASEVIWLHRADAWTSRIAVTVADLTALENKFANEFETDAKIQAHINHGKDKVFYELELQGFNKQQLFNLSKSLDKMVLYASLASACRDLASEGDTTWKEKSAYYDKEFTRLLASGKVYYDSQGNDQPEPKQRSRTGLIRVIR